MATYEGWGLCDKKEYHAAFGDRLQYDQLSRDELYVARFDIENHEKAFRLLGRVGMIQASRSAKNILRFQILDNDLQPVDLPTLGTMTDGLWNPKDVMVYTPPDNAPYHRVLNGCFGEYDEGEGRGLHAEFQLLLERELDLQLRGPLYAEADPSLL